MSHTSQALSIPAYYVKPITPEQWELAASIISNWEMGHDENFEGISVDELEMFFARRAELVGHTNLLYQTSTDEVVGVAGLMYDPSREKFWTQTAAKFGSPFIPATVLETIKNAQSIEPAFKLQPVVNDKDPSHIAAWESHGFRKIQTSYVMKRTHLPTEYPILPTGVNMRTLSCAINAFKANEITWIWSCHNDYCQFDLLVKLRLR